MGFMFKHFRGEGGCTSYLVGDATARKACIVDPRVDELDLIEAFVAAHVLSVELVLDTHTHADHYSATHLIAQKLGAKVGMSARTGSQRAALKLNDGDELGVGCLGIKALATPGHTPDSLSFVASGEFGKLVLTGDTLFIGGSGRTDFPGADAGEQYDSIYDRLGALDGATWVLPGHDYSGLLFSTIAEEKNKNPHWAYKDRGEFIRMKESEALESGGVLEGIVQFNLNAAPVTRPRGGSHAACATACVSGPAVKRHSVHDLSALLAEKKNAALFVDVREPDEFERGRIEGMVNIPLSRLFLHWRELAAAPEIYFFCQRANRSLVALRTAQRLGLANTSDIEGGILAWIAAGYPVKKS